MPKITRPTESGRTSNTRISTAINDGTADLGRAISNIGVQVSNTRVGADTEALGSLIRQEGTRHFETSKRAHQSGLLASKLADASVEFEKAVSERSRTLTDKDGNPTFDKLEADIDAIGRDIANKVGNKILDKEVADQFRQNFDRQIIDARLRGLKTARSQQLDFTRSGLDKGLNSIVEQAKLADFEEVPNYEAQAVTLLDNALAGGAISGDNYAARLQEFQAVLRRNNLSNTIKVSPEKASAILANDAAALGLDEETKSMLDAQLNAKITSDKIAEIEATQQQEVESNNQKNILISELNKRINAGIIRPDELLEAKELIPETTFKAMSKQLQTKLKKDEKERAELADIGRMLADKTEMYTVTPGKVNKHYNATLQTLEQQLGRTATLEEKAQIASNYPLAVSDFANNLENVILHSKSADAITDALKAYTLLHDQNADVVLSTSFPAKVDAKAASLNNLINNVGLTPQEALQFVADSDERLSADTKAALGKNFEREVKKGLPTNDLNKLTEEVADELADELVFTLSDVVPFAQGPVVDNDTALTYREILKEMYIQTNGDLKAAKDAAKSIMNRNHGITHINGYPQYIKNPLEKSLPGVSSESLRKALVAETKELIGDDVDEDGIQVFSLDTNRVIPISGEDRTVNVPVFGVSYIDKNGLPKLVIKENGQALNWSPVGSAVLSSELQAQADQEQTKINKLIDEARDIEASRGDN